MILVRVWLAGHFQLHRDLHHSLFQPIERDVPLWREQLQPDGELRVEVTRQGVHLLELREHVGIGAHLHPLRHITPLGWVWATFSMFYGTCMEEHT